MTPVSWPEIQTHGWDYQKGNKDLAPSEKYEERAWFLEDSYAHAEGTKERSKNKTRGPTSS
jgi:hypothetical protein